MMSVLRSVIASALSLVVLGGCTSKATRQGQGAIRSYYNGDFVGAAGALRPLADETNEDFVLNNVRLGSVALTNYTFDEAEAAFLKAYEVMNSVGVNNGGRTLGAVMVSESLRVWKGQPFDRAMVNFYLGLIYYARRDYDNARAAFENSLFKLREYGEEKKEDKYREVESKFVLGYLMLAKSWQRLGREDLAEANFRRVRELRPDLAMTADPGLNARSNFLLVVDTGYGPSIATDFDGAIAGFTPTPAQAGPIACPTVYVDGRALADNNQVVRPTVDMLAIAQDRVWQSIDTLRTIKSAVGTGLIAAGAFEGVRGAYGSGSAQRRDLIASAALVGAGLLLKATSQADTRVWELLPRTTFVIPMYLEPGMHDLRIQLPTGVSQTWRDVQLAPGSEETTFYVRLLPWRDGPFQWPPPYLATPDLTTPTSAPVR
jgi:hypothetical protein